jgi:hypothetical protein
MYHRSILLNQTVGVDIAKGWVGPFYNHYRPISHLRRLFRDDKLRGITRPERRGVDVRCVYIILMIYISFVRTCIQKTPTNSRFGIFLDTIHNDPAIGS